MNYLKHEYKKSFHIWANGFIGSSLKNIKRKKVIYFKLQKIQKLTMIKIII